MHSKETTITAVCFICNKNKQKHGPSVVCFLGQISINIMIAELKKGIVKLVIDNYITKLSCRHVRGLLLLNKPEEVKGQYTEIYS